MRNTRPVPPEPPRTGSGAGSFEDVPLPTVAHLDCRADASGDLWFGFGPRADLTERQVNALIARWEAAGAMEVALRACKVLFEETLEYDAHPALQTVYEGVCNALRDCYRADQAVGPEDEETPALPAMPGAIRQMRRRGAGRRQR